MGNRDGRLTLKTAVGEGTNHRQHEPITISIRLRIGQKLSRLSKIIGSWMLESWDCVYLRERLVVAEGLDIFFLEILDDGGVGKEEALPFPFRAEPARGVALTADGTNFLFVVTGVTDDEEGAFGKGG